MKLAIFTGNATRHRAFALMALRDARFRRVRCFLEAKKDSVQESSFEEGSVRFRHLRMRSEAEEMSFGELLRKEEDTSSGAWENVSDRWFSSNECLEEMKRYNPDFILVYGTSIIKGSILDVFRKKILNLHLGLSPYYRGSGTNFFPFVNAEPEFVGATYMYMDAGIDTGEIIHQIRPFFLPGASFHQLSNEFLHRCFAVYLSLVDYLLNHSVVNVSSYSTTIRCRTRNVFKKKDFTEEAVMKLHRYFEKDYDVFVREQVDRGSAVQIKVIKDLREE